MRMFDIRPSWIGKLCECVLMSNIMRKQSDGLMTYLGQVFCARKVVMVRPTCRREVKLHMIG